MLFSPYIKTVIFFIIKVRGVLGRFIGVHNNKPVACLNVCFLAVGNWSEDIIHILLQVVVGTHHQIVGESKEMTIVLGGELAHDAHKELTVFAALVLVAHKDIVEDIAVDMQT